jgi:uncharacterized lipoprotein YddW (UPF0748 family)
MKKGLSQYHVRHGLEVCENSGKMPVPDGRRVSRIPSLLSAFLLVTTLAGCQPGLRHGATPKGGIRAIWVTRWDYKTPGDIVRVMENCRRAGFNTVLFQVRGNGTVMYPSRLEPWADEVGGRDPGFDPLKLACREAHRRGMSLHAWVNVVPGWRGKAPPTDRRQLYWSRAAWFWRDEGGRRQPFGWYNSLNPCYPEVRKYLVAVMQEIVSRYPVDGLHMDYIRFPNDWHDSYQPASKVPDYPRDPRTLALFRRATGHTPESNKRAWDAWRTEQVTQLVRDIRAMMRATKPRAILSSAVGASPDEANRNHHQDTRRWMAEGLVDVVYPMNYAIDSKTFDRRLRIWSGMRSRIPVVTGIMFDGREISAIVRQIQQARRSSPHIAAFAYNSLFERPAAKVSHQDEKSSDSRRSLRKYMIPFLRRLAQ